MSEAAEQRVAELELELADLEQQYFGLQMMLAFVLKTTGPVDITQETMQAGIEPGQGISVEDVVAGQFTRVCLAHTSVDETT